MKIDNILLDKLTAKAIEEHFNAELIVLPWNKPEYFGHADGLVRYVEFVKSRVRFKNISKSQVA